MARIALNELNETIEEVPAKLLQLMLLLMLLTNAKLKHMAYLEG